MLKKLLVVSLSLFTINAFADIPDYYAGFQAGYSSTEKSSANSTINDESVSLTQNKNSGLAGRFFVGYAVTPFYAMEIGLARYNSASWTTTVDDQAVPDTTVSLYGIDTSMRFSWVNKPAFSVYNSLGLTYINAHYGSYNDAFQLNQSKYFLRPKVGLGGNYNVNQATQVNLSYTHIFGKGQLNSALNTQKSSDYLPSIGVVALGLIYNF